MSKSAYIIELDNGQSYEDHDRSTICVFLNEEEAEDKIVEWTAWAKREHDKLPDAPDFNLNDEDYAKQHDIRVAAIKTIKPPQGIDELVELVDNYGMSNAFLLITKVPLLG